jgi:hypothetical protein
MTARLDHLVVAAISLEQGVQWCEATFGITPGPGGVHSRMGTHNRLFSIASEAFPEAYFEIIAIDPAAPPPGRPRWFGLDAAALRSRIAQQPLLLHAVARTPLLEMQRWGLINIGIHPGEPLSFERASAAGSLAWRMLVRDDGQLLCGGALPTLIEWQGERHPAQAMPGSGVVLKSLVLQGVPARAQAVLKLRGVAVSDTATAPALSATFSSPRGDITLCSEALA